MIDPARPRGAARPRDRYGRPLRRDDDSVLAFPSVTDRSFVSAEDAWQDALSFLGEDLPFHAHEVFEQRWRCAPQAERALWRALAQWCAAVTHAARGNEVGARRVAERAREGLARVSAIEPVDIGIVLSSLDRLAEA